jgi:hypothetical protein
MAAKQSLMTYLEKFRSAFLAAFSVAVLSMSGAGLAQSNAKSPYAALDALPDWGGIWTLDFASFTAAMKDPPPPLKGQYKQAFEAWQREVRRTAGQVKAESSACRPPGMPGIMGVPQYPIEFLFTPGRITTHHEAWMQWRNIYTDGRSHPADLDPSFNGHSIGRWEGDVLIVDTVGIKTSLELSMGAKHSDKLHIVERIYLAKGDPDTLLVEMTLEDPLALEKPWTRSLRFKRSRDAELIEFICAENDRNPVDASGRTKFE